MACNDISINSLMTNSQWKYWWYVAICNFSLDGEYWFPLALEVQLMVYREMAFKLSELLYTCTVEWRKLLIIFIHRTTWGHRMLYILRLIPLSVSQRFTHWTPQIKHFTTWWRRQTTLINLERNRISPLVSVNKKGIVCSIKLMIPCYDLRTCPYTPMEDTPKKQLSSPLFDLILYLP